MTAEPRTQATAPALLRREDGVAVVTLNRPEAGNAVNGEMRDALNEIWREVESDDDVRVIVLTGAGARHFCTGADMKWQAQLSRDAEAVRATMGNVGRTIQWPDIPRTMSKPVILAINGVVAGGGWHYVCQSDFAIAAEHAEFLEPHVSVGWVPVREMLGLATRAPFGEVMRMAMMGTAERMNAARAYQLGIVTELVPAERLLARTLEVAGAISKQAPLAVRAIKELMHRAYSLELAYPELLAHAELLRDVVHRGPDAKEGPRAFAEKRVPRWTGSLDPGEPKE